MTELASLRIAIDTKDLKKADVALRKLEGTGKKTESSLKKLPTVFTAIVASMAIREVIRYSDTMTLVNSKLKLVTKSSGELVEVQKALFDIAQESRVGFEDTVDLYSRMARSTQELGLSTEELLLVTDNISKSLIISGGSTESMNAALVQLGQGFASGQLRGEELNSVLEQTPRLARMISDGMGIAYGDLRKYAAEGKITSEALINAIKSQTDTVGAEFGQMTMTVSQSLTQIDNSFMVFIGTLNEATGATDILSGAFSGASGILDDLNQKLIEWNNTVNTISDISKKSGVKIWEMQLNDAKTKLKELTDEGVAWYENEKQFAQDVANQKWYILELEKLITEEKAKQADIAASAPIKTEKPKELTKEEIAEKIDPRDEANAHIEAYYARIEAEDQLQVNYIENLLLKTEALRESLLTEEELLNNRAENEVLMLEEAFNASIISEEEKNTIMLELAAQYQNALTDISIQGMSAREKFSSKSSSDQTKQVLGDMVTMTAGMANQNKTMFQINKAAALANAAVQLPASVMKTFEAYPAPLSFVMGGLAAAAGLAQIAAISSASFGGGGSTSTPTPSGGMSTTMGTVPSDIGVSAVGEVQTVKEVTINMPEDATMSTDSVRELIERIQEESGDMGLSLVIAS